MVACYCQCWFGLQLEAEPRREAGCCPSQNLAVGCKSPASQQRASPCIQKLVLSMFDWMLHEFPWKEMLRQVFSYKQKNDSKTISVEQHLLYWLAVSLRNCFSPKLRCFLSCFTFFCLMLWDCPPCMSFFRMVYCIIYCVNKAPAR